MSITKSLDLLWSYCFKKSPIMLLVWTMNAEYKIHTEHGVRLYSYVKPKVHFGSHLFLFLSFFLTVLKGILGAGSFLEGATTY